LIDLAALASQGISAESECTAAAAKKPFAAFLDDLTASIGLTWRAIDGHSIEITTRQAAAEHMDVELYPARNLAGDANAAQALVAEIRSKIAPELWGDKPGQTAIQFDEASGALIIRAPQRIQAQIEELLVSRRKM
jgi:hypothetical protein